MAKRTTSKKSKKMCARCGGCCTGTVVPVTDADVRRLKKESGIPAEKFVRLYAPNETDYERDREGWIRFSYGRRLMGLKRPLGDKCFFLDDNNECTSYLGRAMTCRTFPYMVQLYTDGSVEEITLNHAVGCGVPQGAKIPVRQLTLNARQEDAEDEAYYRKVAKWNKKPKGGKKEFLKFLKL